MNTRKEKEVWEACDDLIASGMHVRQLTGEVISNRLRELGYKAGNPNYRYKYRDTWMQARGLSREESVLQVEKHDTIDRAAAIFRKQIEESIKTEYEKKYELLNALVKETEEKWKISEKTLHETLEGKNYADQAVEKLLGEKTELNTKIRQINDTMLVQQERLRGMELELATTRNDANRHQAAIKKEHDGRVAFLENQLMESKMQHKDMMAILKQELAKQNEQAKKEAEQFRTQIRELEKQSYQKDMLNTKIKEENHRHELILERVETELREIREEFKTSQEKYHAEKLALQESLTHEQRQVSILEGELKQAEQQIERHRKEHQQFQDVIYEQKERLIRLEIGSKNPKKKIVLAD